MLLIISDIHFGQADPAAERAKEKELLDLLESAGESLEGVYLLGDVFDQYVEYRYLVPKGFARFQARLAALTDAGVPVHYVVGNHDPWHLDYFEHELGVRVAHGALTLRLDGRTLHLEHGDDAGRSPLSTAFRRFIRHPVPFALFRTLLPADFAYRLTRWTKDRFGSDVVNPVTVRELDLRARTLLEHGADAVIMGHSHVPQCAEYGGGVYVNPGSWHVDRAFVAADASSIVVRRWNGDDIFVYPFQVAESGRSGM